MAIRHGLGRGLGALIKDGTSAAPNAGSGGVPRIPTDKIRRNASQPRQRFDAETLAWLAYLASKTQASSIHLLVTLRSETLPGESALAGVFSAPGQRLDLDLDRLSETETASLAGYLFGEQPSPGQLEQIYYFSEGNPLFITEWIRAGFGATGQRQVLPGRVKTVIEERLSQLSAITIVTPRYMRAVAACSRDDPVPKFRPATRTSPSSTFDWKLGS